LITSCSSARKESFAISPETTRTTELFETKKKPKHERFKLAPPVIEKAPEPIVSSSQPKKLSFKDKYELEQITSRIAELEERKKSLEAELIDPSIAVDRMTEVSKELGTVIPELDEKEMRWLELSEMAQ